MTGAGRRIFSAILGVGACVALAATGAAFAARAKDQAAQTGLRVALIIGNSDYSSVPSLGNPSKDARVIEKALLNVGFRKVQRLEDLDKNDMDKALQKFTDLAKGADAAVIYYAGHGMEVNGVNYVIPVDAKLADLKDAQYEAVPLEHVLSAVSGAQKLKLVILDACRNNPFTAKMKGEKRAVGRGLARLSDEQLEGDTLVAFSAGAGSTADDNSGYAKAFSDAIKQPGVDVFRVLGKIRKDVMTSTHGEQVPAIYGSPGSQSFYFVDAPAGAVVPDAKAPVATVASVSSVDPMQVELTFWQSVRDSNDVNAYRSYLNKYPDGEFADLARMRVLELMPFVPEVQRVVDAARAAEAEARQKAEAARAAQTKAQSANGKSELYAKTSTLGGVSQTQVVTQRYVEQSGKDGRGLEWHYAGQVAAGGVMNGFGVMAWADNDRFEGEWHDDSMNGGGVYFGGPTKQFREKVGQFSNGKNNGYGVVYWKNGMVTLGQWKNDKLTGYGATLNASGKPIEQGLYEGNVLKTAMKP